MNHPQDQSARDAKTQAPQAPQAPQSAEATAGTPAGQAAQQETSASQYVPRPAPSPDETRSLADTRYEDARPAGAALGFTITAAVLMTVSGLWNFLEGLAAIIRGRFFVTLPNYAYNISITGWGWFHLILGAAVFTAGVFLFMDKIWARIVGVVLACISALVNFLYIPYFPVWSVVVIALDIFIVWALLAPRTRYRV